MPRKAHLSKWFLLTVFLFFSSYVVVRIADYNSWVAVDIELKLLHATFGISFPGIKPPILEIEERIAKTGVPLSLDSMAIFFLLTILLASAFVADPYLKDAKTILQFTASISFGLWTFSASMLTSLRRNLEQNIISLYEMMIRGPQIGDVGAHLIVTSEHLAGTLRNLTSLYYVSGLSFFTILFSILLVPVLPQKLRILAPLLILAQLFGISLLILQVLILGSIRLD